MIVLYSFNSTALALNLANALSCSYKEILIKKFFYNEIEITLDHPIKNERVIIVCSIYDSINDTILELLLTANYLKRNGAKEVVAVMPYMPYSRQDKGASPVIALLGSFMKSSGIDKVITLDMHSKKALQLFGIETENISSLEIFKSSLYDKKDYVVVSPDSGGIERAANIAKFLESELVIIEKSRLLDRSCNIIKFSGNVEGKKCLIVDDIVDSGGTLLAATNILIANKAITVEALITHGLFSNECLAKLNNSKLSKIYISNSISCNNTSDLLKVIDITPLIAAHLIASAV